MALKLIPKGDKIKALRESQEIDYRQKTIAAKARISERELRRIEIDSKPTKAEVLRRLATALNTTLEEIAFAANGPDLVTQNGKVVTGATQKSQRTPSDSDFITIPRFSTTYLHPVKGAQHLFDEAGYAQEIVPHILVETEPELFDLIEELLTLLKGIVRRTWSSLGPAPADDYDNNEFPDVSRLKRLSEILVLLKGNDIRVAIDTHIKYYRDGDTPWLSGQKFFQQLLIAFAPTDEYVEDTVEVPIDHGKDVRLPTKPVF